ncbi:MAG: prenyltransferase/squalene oxidase repeat-containing protein [Planctomycetota bacterium]
MGKGKLAGAILCLASVAVATELDVATARAMDAQAHGEWLAAAAAYQQAIGEGKGTPFQRIQMRAVQRDAKKQVSAVLSLLKKMKRPQWEADAAAGILTLIPNQKRAQATLARLSKDGIEARTMPQPFPSRSPMMRAVTGTTLGKSFAAGELAADRAILYLLSQQEKEGFWDSDKHGGQPLYDEGLTAMAMLAMTARGPSGISPDMHESLGRAARWLLEKQEPDGGFGTRVQHGIYNTTLVCEALCEHAIVTGQQDRFLKPLGRVVDRISKHQGEQGGWRYVRGEPGDTSVTSRAVLALVRARQAGLSVSSARLRNAGGFIDSMMDEDDGTIGYNARGGASARPEGLHEQFPADRTEAMSAAGGFTLAHVAPAHKSLQSPLGLVRRCLPDKRVPDFYYWMNGAYCQATIAGTVSPEWYAALVKGVAATQLKNGSVRPDGPWGVDGGVIYATAACVLALTGPYREGRLVQPMVQFQRSGKIDAFVSGAGAVASRVFVRRGDQLSFYDAGTAWHKVLRRSFNANGVEDIDRSFKRIVKRAPWGCLLARIGEKGKPFAPGIAEAYTMPADGPLYLMMNCTGTPIPERGWWITIKRENR